MKRSKSAPEGEEDSVDEGAGGWSGSGQRRRRDLVSRACEPCRRSKTKCDEQRPCARCTARRTISQCLGKVPLQSLNGFVECTVPASVERPIAYEAVHSDNGTRSASEPKRAWDILPTVEAGWSDEAINSVFDGLPPALRAKLLNGFRMMDGVKKQSLMAVPDVPPSAETLAAIGSVEATERQMWNTVPTTGVLQISLDPSTGQRRSLFMNQRFASIFGYHREELLTRMVQRQVPMAMSHLEFLCIVVDEVSQAGDISSDRVLRVSSDVNETAVLAKHLIHKHFDQHGRLMRINVYVEAVDNATYDQLRAKTPPVTRPFAQHLGDMRSGEELTKQAKQDLNVTMIGIQQSSEAGMRLVQEFDHLVTLAFERFLAVAANAAKAALALSTNTALAAGTQLSAAGAAGDVGGAGVVGGGQFNNLYRQASLSNVLGSGGIGDGGLMPADVGGAGGPGRLALQLPGNPNMNMMQRLNSQHFGSSGNLMSLLSGNVAPIHAQTPGRAAGMLGAMWNLSNMGSSGHLGGSQNPLMMQRQDTSGSMAGWPQLTGVMQSTPQHQGQPMQSSSGTPQQPQQPQAVPQHPAEGVAIGVSQEAGKQPQGQDLAQGGQSGGEQQQQQQQQQQQGQGQASSSIPQGSAALPPLAASAAGGGGVPGGAMPPPPTAENYQQQLMAGGLGGAVGGMMGGGAVVPGFSGQMVMLPNVVLRQGSLQAMQGQQQANLLGTDAGAAVNAIGELGRQGSLNAQQWQNMAANATGLMLGRPELSRSDTELSFSMVW